MTSTRLRFFALPKYLFFFFLLIVLLFDTTNAQSRAEILRDQNCREIENGGKIVCENNNTGRVDRVYNCGSGSSVLCTDNASPRSSVIGPTGRVEDPQSRQLQDQSQALLAEKDRECKTRYGEHTKYSTADGRCVDNSGGPLWKCTLGVLGAGLAGCLTSIADFVIGNLFLLINSILATILAMAMWVLDAVIYITIVKFRTNFVDLGLNLAPFVSETGIAGDFAFGSNRRDLIYYIWGMLRDFVNLLLLITIIYFAVRTMFEGYEGKAKQFIYLLIFSIVINFSLFFVKFAIDVSNILTLQAYTLMVTPAGFDNWDDFRKKQNQTQSSTLGEYLLNVANIGGVHKLAVADPAAAQMALEGMKKSWVYQVGVAIIYIALIYLVFFLISFLVIRVAAFLFAMLVAAFLAADIFFRFVEKSSKGTQYEFVEKIRSVTDKIRNEFYEALIRGPLLFLFLFLVGVLANAIFNQGLAAMVQNISAGSKEFAVLGTAFGASLTIFMKFGVFFALCMVLFNKINNITLGENKGWVGSGGQSFANFLMRNTVGRGAGALGWAGRNTIGRGTGNVANRLVNRFATNDVNLTNRVNGASNAVTRFGWQTLQQLNNFGQTRAASLQKGNLVTGAYNVNKGLAAAAKRATGADVDFGTGFDKGYEEEDKDRKTKRAGREEERTKRTAAAIKGAGLTDDEKEKLYRTEKIKFGGVEYTLEDAEKIAEDADKKIDNSSGRNISERMQNAYNDALTDITYTGQTTIGGVAFRNASDVEKIFKKGIPGNFSKSLEDKKHTAEEAALRKKIGGYEESRTEQVAEGRARTFLQDGIDIRGRNIPLNLPNRVSGATADMEEHAQEAQMEGIRKKAKESADKIKKQIDAMRGTFTSNISEIDNIISLPAVGAVPAPATGAVAAEIAYLTNFRDDLGYHLNPATRPVGYVAKSNEDYVKDFNKDTKDDLFKAKTKVLEELRDQYNRVRLGAGATPRERQQLGQRKRAIESALERLEAQKTAYEAITKPAAGHP